MTNVQATTLVAQPAGRALPTLPGCGQPATTRIEAFSPAIGAAPGGSLEASLYVCADHVADAVVTLQAADLNFYRVAGGDGVKRCGDGMDFTGARTVPLVAPDSAEAVSAAAAGQLALIRIARANMLRAISRECFAVDRDALPAPRAVRFDSYTHAAQLDFDTQTQAEAWAERLGGLRSARVWALVGATGYHAIADWRGVRVDLVSVVPVRAGAAPGTDDQALIASPQPEPEADSDGIEQEWLFTFGAGQQHDGRFVRVFGTFEDARERMCRVFGTAWCDQYTWRSFDAAGLPGRVTELPESEWPTPAAEPADGDAIVIPAADVNAFIGRVAYLAGAGYGLPEKAESEGGQ